jgi:hypothetical protein
MSGMLKKRRVIAALTVVGALALAGGAFAYFTSSGTGTGSVSVGSAGAWSLTSGTATGPALAPDPAVGGANVESIPYTVKNTGSGSESLSQVVVSVLTGTGAAWSSQTQTAPPCTAADFSVDGAAPGSPAVDTHLAGDLASGQSKTGTVTVELIDNGQNQNNCEGVSVPLYFSAS